jgi:rhodanese-related sulfurtransferase
MTLLVMSVFFSGMLQSWAQLKVGNPEFDKLLQGLLDHDVPEMAVNEACDTFPVLFLDARERQEFEVSHLPGAIWIGYDDFKLKRISEISKDQPIVVYCSVGYRSERITKKLINAGYSKVSNLYGGIFEWTNRGYTVENEVGPVKKVHTYNKDWSRWVTKAAKVY